MKKKFHSNSWTYQIIKTSLGFAAVAILQIFTSALANASADLDRQYALENITCLRSWDNVDGLFAEYVTEAYQDFFSKQSRFLNQDIGKADGLLTASKIPYLKLIQDPEILRQVARAVRADSLLRTKITKTGERYRFEIDWIYAPKMEVLAKEAFDLGSPGNGLSLEAKAIHAELQSHLKKLLKQVPYEGQVTGRDGSVITLNIGTASGLKKGDTLVLGTVDEIKKHPLLKEIVDWRITQTAKAQIDQVEANMSFGRITEEDSNRAVSRYQKIIQIIPGQSLPSAESLQPLYGGRKSREDLNRSMSEIPEEDPARLGWVEAQPWLSSWTRTFTDTGVGKEGSGVAKGAKIEGQLWLNRNWFLQGGLNYGFAQFSQTDTLTQQASTGVDGDLSATRYHYELGYHYLPSRNFFGPKGWVKLGYQSFQLSIPKNDTEKTGSATFSGLLAGFGADLPIRGGFGGIFSLDLGIMNSGITQGIGLGDPSGISTINLYLGGYYRLSQKMMARLGAEILSQSADFSSGASLNQRLVTYGPSLMFYF
jgi:hypothetical protein